MILGLPDDVNTLDELRHKDDNTATSESVSGAKRGDKVKIYENRTKMSKSLLGKTGLIGGKDENIDETHEVIVILKIYVFCRLFSLKHIF